MSLNVQNCLEISIVRLLSSLTEITLTFMLDHNTDVDASSAKGTRIIQNQINRLLTLLLQKEKNPFQSSFKVFLFFCCFFARVPINTEEASCFAD